MDETRELDTSTFDRGVEMVNDVNAKRIKDSFQFLSFFFFLWCGRIQILRGVWWRKLQVVK